jgi:hypothetical protein
MSGVARTSAKTPFVRFLRDLHHKPILLPLSQYESRQKSIFYSYLCFCGYLCVIFEPCSWHCLCLRSNADSYFRLLFYLPPQLQPLTSADLAIAHDLKMYPAFAGSVVNVYNIPRLPAGTPPLILSRSNLVAIFTRQITSWGDPLLTMDNPWLAPFFLQQIVLVVRADSSGTTNIFSNALSHFDASFASRFHLNTSDPSSSWGADRLAWSSGAINLTISSLPRQSNL